jgi:hypothetical protein
MGTFISPDGNPEVWEDKPASYFTPEDWEAAHPAPPPPNLTPEQEREKRRLEILFELAALDAKLLTPRTLAEAVKGGAYALACVTEHEFKAAPLREELASLSADQGEAE